MDAVPSASLRCAQTDARGFLHNPEEVNQSIQRDLLDYIQSQIFEAIPGILL